MSWFRRKAKPPPPLLADIVEEHPPSLAIRTLITLAAAIVTLVGIHLVSQVFGALALAMIFTLCAYPLRFRLEEKGVNPGIAAFIVVVVVWISLIGLAIVAVYAIGRFSEIVTDYAPEFTQAARQFGEWLGSLGIGSDQVAGLLEGISPASIASFAAGLLGSVINFATGLVFVFTFVLLLAIDVTSLRTLASSLQQNRPNFLGALQKFARTSRQYLSITAGFGALTAIADGVVLVLLGIEAPFLWVVLAFITNFIPNVGFVIGLLPPAILALLANGWQSAVLVIVFYSLLNIAVQSFIQPLIVGHSVGLNQTLSFLSLILWTIVLGPIGALLAIPLTLFTRAVLVEADPNSKWVRPLLGDLPDGREPKRRRRRKPVPSAPA